MPAIAAGAAGDAPSATADQVLSPYIYVFYAPPVLISHLLIFWILIKSNTAMRITPRAQEGRGALRGSEPR